MCAPRYRSSDEFCRPNRGIISIEMLASQGPVGTRGGVVWMRGPCACPRWGATFVLHEVPNGSRCHQDKHRPPPCPTSAPCPYRTGNAQYPIRSAPFIFLARVWKCPQDILRLLATSLNDPLEVYL